MDGVPTRPRQPPPEDGSTLAEKHPREEKLVGRVAHTRLGVLEREFSTLGRLASPWR